MEYTHISKTQQVDILNGRIAGWEADHFGHTINLAALEANKVPDDQKKTTTDALATLEASILAGRKELAALQPEADDEADAESGV